MPVNDNASVASLDISRKRSFRETLRSALSPADKEKLQKLDTKCKLLKHSIKTFSEKTKKATVEELHKAENKWHDARRKVTMMQNRVNEKRNLLESVTRDKDELVEKMNSDIDMAAGPSEPSENEE